MLKKIIRIINFNTLVSKKSGKTDLVKIRNNKYDNLKGLGIILVILCHLLGLTQKITIYDNIYNLLLVIIMPMFFFISGYFSKNKADVIIKSFKRLLIPYIIFTIFWIIYNSFILGNGIPTTPFFTPVYGLWFLLSLFTMKLFLPIISKIKYIFWISLAISLLIGIINIPENFLALMRTFCFLPAFIFGYRYDSYKNLLKEKIPKIAIKNILKNKIIIFLILIIFLVLLGIYVSDIPSSALLYKLSYQESNLTNIEGIMVRAITIISSIISTLLLVFLMTDKKIFLTKIGINSLSVYILHFYFIRFISEKIVGSDFNFLFTNIWISGLFIGTFTIFITYILSRNFITTGINKLMSFIEKFILIPENK